MWEEECEASDGEQLTQEGLDVMDQPRAPPGSATLVVVAGVASVLTTLAVGLTLRRRRATPGSNLVSGTYSEML